MATSNFTRSAYNYLTNWASHKINGHIYPTLQLRVVKIDDAIELGCVKKEHALKYYGLGLDYVLVDETPTANEPDGNPIAIGFYTKEEFAFAKMDALIASEQRFFDDMMHNNYNNELERQELES